MAGLTPKENYLRIGYGEMPEWVPNWTMGMRGPNSAIWSAGPTKLTGGFGPPPGEPGTKPPTEWTDSWGITMVANEETGYAGLPKPGHFILSDVTKWDKVVKHPAYHDDFFTTDWEAMAKEDLSEIDRSQYGVTSNVGFGPFTTLISYMGFTEGLCALLEEPDAVKEMLNYICDYYTPIIERTIEFYKPDVVSMFDDTASKYAPFFSVEVYRDIFKPIYARISKVAQDRGIPIQFHNCGRAEDFVADMIDFGVRFWDPAQQSNDLLKVKEDFKGQIAVCGGFDFVPPADRDATEDEVRSYVRSVLDKFAPGGGYAFCGGIIGPASKSEITMKLNGWIQDEVVVYGKDFYKK